MWQVGYLTIIPDSFPSSFYRLITPTRDAQMHPRALVYSLDFPYHTILVGTEGNDPSTPVLSGQCSTSELCASKFYEGSLAHSGHLQPITYGGE